MPTQRICHFGHYNRSTLAARPRMDLLQTGSYAVMTYMDPSTALLRPTYTVVFHACCRHDIQTTAAVFYLSSSGRPARSSLYNRQAGVSGFWCHRLEGPASQRHICAVTRGFQTTTRDISPSRSYQDVII